MFFSYSEDLFISDQQNIQVNTTTASTEEITSRIIESTTNASLTHEHSPASNLTNDITSTLDSYDRTSAENTVVDVTTYASTNTSFSSDSPLEISGNVDNNDIAIREQRNESTMEMKSGNKTITKIAKNNIPGELDDTNNTMANNGITNNPLPNSTESNQVHNSTNELGITPFTDDNSDPTTSIDTLITTKTNSLNDTLTESTSTSDKILPSMTTSIENSFVNNSSYATSTEVPHIHVTSMSNSVNVTSTNSDTLITGSKLDNSTKTFEENSQQIKLSTTANPDITTEPIHRTNLTMSETTISKMRNESSTNKPTQSINITEEINFTSNTPFNNISIPTTIQVPINESNTVYYHNISDNNTLLPITEIIVTNSSLININHSTPMANTNITSEPEFTDKPTTGIHKADETLPSSETNENKTTSTTESMSTTVYSTSGSTFSTLTNTSLLESSVEIPENTVPSDNVTQSTITMFNETLKNSTNTLLHSTELPIDTTNHTTTTTTTNAATSATDATVVNNVTTGSTNSATISSETEVTNSSTYASTEVFTRDNQLTTQYPSASRNITEPDNGFGDFASTEYENNVTTQSEYSTIMVS